MTDEGEEEIDWFAPEAWRTESGKEGESVTDFNRFRAENGLSPVKSNRGKKKPRSFTLSDEALDGLKILAQQFSIVRGSDVSMSALIESIGLFEIGLVDHRRDIMEHMLKPDGERHGTI